MFFYKICKLLHYCRHIPSFDQDFTQQSYRYVPRNQFDLIFCRCRYPCVCVYVDFFLKLLTLNLGQFRCVSMKELIKVGPLWFVMRSIKLFLSRRRLAFWRVSAIFYSIMYLFYLPSDYAIRFVFWSNKLTIQRNSQVLAVKILGAFLSQILPSHSYRNYFRFQL